MLRRQYAFVIFLFMIFSSCASSKDVEKHEDKSPLWGIDISHYQEITSWNKLKEQEPGFIFLKATEGTSIKDNKYKEYYQKIKELEIPVGSYHFFSYKSTGIDQANNFLETANYQRGDLPLVLDAEYSKKMPGKKAVQKELLDFITAIYKKTNSYPIIYCPHRYYLQYMKEILPENCPLWIVDYQNKPSGEWTFWQTTEKYKINGIKGYVDFNLFNGTKKELKKMLF